MGLSADRLHAALTALSEVEPGFAAGLTRYGKPEPRISERGYESLLRTMVGQQVSVAAARSIWNKVDAAVGGAGNPANLLAASDETLRGAGLSRQKIGYARSFAEEVASGRLPLDALPEDDEEAIALMTRVKGIGRWSAEIYLLFAEGRADVWPAGDLAVQVEVGHLLGHEARPTEKVLRGLCEPWRPYRGALAILAWHHYGHRRGLKGADAAPLE